MKPRFPLLVNLAVYAIIPFAIIPALSLVFKDWLFLIGIVFYFIGMILSYYRQGILLAVPFLFCGWYWFTYGLGIRDYVSIYMASLLSGFFAYESRKLLDKIILKVIPEEEQNDDFNNKISLLEFEIQEFKKKNPDKKVTQDIVEQIRTEIFF